MGGLELCVMSACEGRVTSHYTCRKKLITPPTPNSLPSGSLESIVGQRWGVQFYERISNLGWRLGAYLNKNLRLEL